MLRKSIAWLAPLALTLVGVGSNVQSVSAQSADDSYELKEFSITYDVLANFGPVINPELNVLNVELTGESIGNAPFGLTNFISRNYGRFETRGSQIFGTFDANPAVFGIEGEIRGDVYFSNDPNNPNQLFGRASDTALIDLEQNTIRGGGTIAIFDGAGVFENATGIITFTQEDTLTPGSTDGPLSSRGQATLNFSIRVPRQVPEPTATTTLLAIGVTGAGLVLRRRSIFN